MANRILSIQFYSSLRLSEEQLRSFSLPGNPYRKEKPVLDYLLDKGIFFYRDDRHGSTGLVLARAGDERFTAYKYSANMETDNRTFCRPVSWPVGGDPYFILTFDYNSVRGVRIDGGEEKERKSLVISADSRRSGGLEQVFEQVKR